MEAAMQQGLELDACRPRVAGMIWVAGATERPGSATASQLKGCADIPTRGLREIRVRHISCRSARRLLSSPNDGKNCPRGWRVRYGVVVAGGPKVECASGKRRIYYYTD